MVRIKLQGGLGNTMFQYALGTSFEFLDRDVEYDLSSIHVLGDCRPHDRRFPQYGLDGFRTVVRKATEVQLPQRATDQVKYESDIFLENNIALHGYWQSEKYILNPKRIESEFVPTEAPSDQTKYWIEQLQDDDAVVLQVRRGDYIQFSDFHGVMGADYFKRGSHLVGGSKAYIITDDETWCRENFQNATIINTGSRHWDIALMAECRKIVISNSSFGWWGSWLGERKHGLKHCAVAPKKWFATDKIDSSDVIPERWYQL